MEEQVLNTHKFSNHDTMKFILLLRKCVYPEKYKDDWEKFSKKLFFQKEDFYSNLIMEGFSNADYTDTKRVGKDFEMKHLGEYRDLYV